MVLVSKGQRPRDGDEPDLLIAASIRLLGHWAYLDVIAAVAELPLRQVTEAVARLESEGVARGIHPVILTVDDCPPREPAGVLPDALVGLLHGRIAGQLRLRGAPAVEICEHLIQAPGAGDPESVRLLRQAARQHMASNRAVGAVACLERAVMEPPPPRLLGSVITELAAALNAAGRHSEALAAAQRGMDHVPGRRDRAAAVTEAYKALLGLGDPDQAIHVLVEEITVLQKADPDLAFELERCLLLSGERHPRVMATSFERYQKLAVDDSLPAGVAYLHAASQIFAMGGHADAEEAARLAVRAMRHWEPDPADVVTPVASLWLLFRADQHAHVTELAGHLRAAVPQNRRHPALQALEAVTILHSASVATALSQLNEAATAVADIDDQFAAEVVKAFYAQALFESDRQEELSRLLAQHDLDDDPPSPWLALLRIVRGRALLESGDPRGALEDFMAVEKQKAGMGVTNPAGFHQGEYAVQALLAQNRRREATAIAELNLERATAWGAASTLARAEQAMALCLPPRTGIGRLNQALHLLSDGNAPLTQAELTVNLAVMLIAAHRTKAAESTLRDALDQATRIGAVRVARHARNHLRTVGAKPRRPYNRGVEALTPAELRVAQQIAEGKSNKEAAEALQLSLRTIENQLHHIYQKLHTDRAGLRTGPFLTTPSDSKHGLSQA